MNMATTELQIGDSVKFRCYGKEIKGTITDFSPDLLGGPALICVKVKSKNKRERDRNKPGES